MVNVARRSTGTLATACALSAALLVAGCGGDGERHTRASGEIVLEPLAAEGPDPFTPSTATSPAAPPPVSRTPGTTASPPGQGTRSFPGSTPGLYAGTERTGSCDVERQIGHLTADRAKQRAFADVVGVSQDAVPAYVRGLAPVTLRADTRVTDHGYREGRAAGYQSVLQAGTAVLVDNRGVPRLRCACGNPLTPPESEETRRHGAPGHRGTPWPGYRPAEVIVVTPAPQVITEITIIDVVDSTWIERRIGHDPRHDKAVRPPDVVTKTPSPSGTPPTGPSPSTPPPSSAGPSGRDPHGRDPRDREPGVPPDASRREESAPHEPLPDCATPTVTVTPGLPPQAGPSGPAGCPPATVTADPPASEPEPPSEPGSRPEPESSSGSSAETGPETVPDTADVPDGGGLVPEATEAAGSIFGSPADVSVS